MAARELGSLTLANASALLLIAEKSPERYERAAALPEPSPN